METVLNGIVASSPLIAHSEFLPECNFDLLLFLPNI
jgi:hypothetical protein